MAIMEGPLSKWTNVMKGWQFRWFVLDENAGLLSYYTSKEKMMRGVRRGCVRLKGAVIGIDDEDDSTFTITVDQKTFHFQARDADEKERWIDALETTIVRHSHISTTQFEGRNVPSMQDFEKKLCEADAYLQILIDQVKDMDMKIDQSDDELVKERYIGIKGTTENMIESIKQSIVLLQIAKAQTPQPAIDAVSLDSLTLENSPQDSQQDMPAEYLKQSLAASTAVASSGILQNMSISMPNLFKTIVYTSTSSSDILPSAHDQSSTPNIINCVQSLTDNRSVNSLPSCTSSAISIVPGSNNNIVTASLQPDDCVDMGVSNAVVPDMSYSSSEDEFVDAEQEIEGAKVNGIKEGRNKQEVEEEEPKTPPTLIASQDDYFDELYDGNEEDELESLDQHGSIITHLLSQVRIGMDLTKIVLPTFILEKRSLLEMFADFLAHPDLFVSITDYATPRERMVACVRWYLSAFHAGKRSPVAKKPYNPILGEIFRCYYDLPGQEWRTSEQDDLNQDGPIPWSTKNHISCIAEQVSHHPPISAFYAEHFNKRITLDGYIWTKSKFLGLSIGVHMIGQAVISVLDYNEEYIITFPNGYGRSILTVPWMELGGKMQVSCAKTGYNATIEFHTKPFYGGKKDQMSAEIYAPNEKKSFCSIKGEWNGVMWAKHNTGFNEKFLDTTVMPIMKKRVLPIDEMDEYESRRLWKDVTKNLKEKNIEKATEAKHKLEQRQREEAKQRKEAAVKWDTKCFHEVGEHWVYDKPLMSRLKTDDKDSKPTTPV